MLEDEPTPEQRFAAEAPEKWVPRDLARGRSREDIVADLLRLDWTSDDAAAFVDRAAADLARYRSSPEGRADLVRESFRQMVGGFTLSAVGAALFIWAVVNESLPAGVGVAGFVLVIVGLVRGSRGYLRWSTYRGDDLPPP